jgi:hypothetical protein
MTNKFRISAVAILLVAIGSLVAIYYKTGSNVQKNISLVTEQPLMPILFFPDRNLGNLIVDMVEKDPNRIYNTALYSIYKMVLKSSDENSKTFSMFFKKKPGPTKSGSDSGKNSLEEKVYLEQNSEEKDFLVNIVGDQLMIQTKDMDNKPIHWLEIDTKSEITFGFVNEKDKFLYKGIYRYYFTKSGIAVTLNNDVASVERQIQYFDSKGSVQIEGFLVSLSYNYLRDLFSQNPVNLGSDKYVFRNFKFYDASDPRYLNIDFDIVINDLGFVIQSGILFQKDSSKVLSLKPLVYPTQPTAAEAIVVNQISSEIRRRFDAEEKGRELVVNLKSTKFYVEQGKLKQEIGLLENGTIRSVNDNIVVYIYNK